MNDSRAFIDRESLVCFIYQSKKFIEERKPSIKKFLCFSVVVGPWIKSDAFITTNIFQLKKKNK